MKRSTVGMVLLLLAVAPLLASSRTDFHPVTTRDAQGRTSPQLVARTNDQAPARQETLAQREPRAESRPATARAELAQREGAALAFVDQHHPELMEVLQYLRRSQRQAYVEAIRDLFRASHRLAELQQRDEPRYELELQLWKTQSRIELMTATLRMDNEPQLNDQLRDAVREKVRLQRQLLDLEAERLNERLQRIAQQRQRLKEQEERIVERQMRALLRERAGDQETSRTRPRAATGTNASNRRAGR